MANENKRSESKAKETNVENNTQQSFVSNNTRCYMKVRPLQQQETLTSKVGRIDILDNESLAFLTNEKQNAVHVDIRSLTHDKLYRSDRNFNPNQRNVSVGNEIFPRIIDNLLDGVSTVVLAIGAEDSGKTHTIFGKLSDPGLLVYFAHALFKKKA